MNYKIINTGSNGNATVIEEIILIDCGVSYKKLEKYVGKLKLVFISHIHQDHFNKTTVKSLAKVRPTLRFAVGKYLVSELLKIGVDKRNIDIIEPNKKYDYRLFQITPVKLYHDVPNLGIRVFIDNKKLIYATDTYTLDGIIAKNYDVYLIEGNYEDEEELHNRAENSYYESRVLKTHLSREYATKWLLTNMGDNSIYEFMHQHREKSICLNN